MTEPADIHKAIRHLQLIRDLISLDKKAEIAEQISKLTEFSTVDGLDLIITLLVHRKYEEAIPTIESFTKKFSEVTVYLDPEVEGLRLEAKSLEFELNRLSDEKAAIDNTVYEFDVRYANELGNLVTRILEIKKNKAKGTPAEKEAEQDYTEYQQQYASYKDQKSLPLTALEKNELKNLYRRASKLCHPDVVSDEQREVAAKIFAELNEAYEQNDLERVRRILHNLENGSFFVSKSEALTEKKKLRMEIDFLRSRISELHSAILEIKESDAYQTILAIDDWDYYFATTKKRLSIQLNELENG